LTDTRNHETNHYCEQLERIGRLTEPAMRQAIAALELRPGTQGLDAGCGDGRHARLLAEAIAPGGRVVGVDLAAEHVAVAQKNAARAGQAEAVTFQEGSVLDLPFADASFDFAWCADTLWPGFVDTARATRELTRVVRPGGVVALAFWRAQHLLPGYPDLEAALDTALAAGMAYLRVAPERQAGRAAEWLRAAGLAHPRTAAFTAEIAGPLDQPRRESVAATLDMLVEAGADALSPEHRARLDRLRDPASDAFVGAQPDYHGLVIYTMFSGRKPD
jgi:demethylmenaquinone methyltransferase / 2-methoxy-6-polyprenyl-1,4-benzoquinol methylase